jgi:acyl-CoA thioester hydrolase
MKTAAPPFSIPVFVEFEDVDSYKIAHHTKLVSYCERCRVRYFSELGFNLDSSDVVIVLYHLEVNFKKPAFFRDALRVTISVKSYDQYRLVLGYRILRGPDLIVRASTGLCFVDPATKTMIAAPDGYLEEIKKILRSGGERA